MLVDTILQNKGALVYTLPETGTLADAVAMLNAHNIGAVVITHKDGTIAGILSERDVVRRLGDGAASALSLTIAECMTRSVHTTSRQAHIDDIMERMTISRVRHMPVTDGKTLIGIVSIGDVVKLKIEQIEREAEELREYIAS